MLGKAGEQGAEKNYNHILSSNSTGTRFSTETESLASNYV